MGIRAVAVGAVFHCGRAVLRGDPGRGGHRGRTWSRAAVMLGRQCPPARFCRLVLWR